MRNIRVVATAMLLALVLGKIGLAEDTAKTSEAQASGERWLALIDSGHCAESYNAASSMFKVLIKREKWVRSCESTRKDTGALISRRFLSSMYAPSLPKMPAAEYVLLKFDNKFQQFSQASELVIMVRQKNDEQWRVAFYDVSFVYKL